MNKLLNSLLTGAFFRLSVDDADGGGEAIGTGNDARIAMLNQIADTNDSGRDDLIEYDDNGNPEPFVVQSAEGEVEHLTDDVAIDEQALESLQALENELNDEPIHQRHKIKVNGRETEISYEELVARAQKVEAADQYLAEAARIRNDLAAKQRAPVQDHVDTSVEDDLAIARAIQMGTEEEAVAALRSLRQSQKSLSPDDLSRTIDERLTFNEAISKFRTVFDDVAGDPYLNKMALDADARLIAQGDTRPYYERYEQIGTEIRNWTKDLARRNAPPAPAAQPQAEKLNRKAAASVAPKANGQKSQSSVEEEHEETTADIISNIAKSRGGPQWMNGVRH